METVYFVDYKLFNSENSGWAYKTELKTTDLAEAERKFGELISTYYGKTPFTVGSIVISDMFGNVLDKKVWNLSAES